MKCLKSEPKVLWIFFSCASTSLLKDQKSEYSMSMSMPTDDVSDIEASKISVAAELSQALSTGIFDIAITG